MNSFTIPLQSHWSDCQYCTYSISGSHTGRYWHRVMDQTHYVFCYLACHLRSLPQICLYHCLHCEALFYLSSPFSCSRRHCNFVLLHTPLPFISPNASSCASPHWLGSKAGWIATMVSVRSRVPVPPQSKHSTASFFSASPPCFHFVLALSFKSISWLSPSLFYKLLLCCLFSDLPHCLCCSQTHWLWTGLTLNPDFYSLNSPFSFLWPLKLTSASRLYCSGWSKTPHPGSVLADTEQSLSTTERS